MVNTSYSHQSVLNSLQLPPLPYQRPLLAIGHGTRNERGRQTFLNFVETYQKLDTSRPVIPCFLELTEPTIQKGVEVFVEQGYTDITALPILLFAARHNKFDVTNELDRSRLPYPQLKLNYGRHFGITPKIIELWRELSLGKIRSIQKTTLIISLVKIQCCYLWVEVRVILMRMEMSAN